ncbi:hypothetical protein ACJMK2_040266 [Sinanodonta woodiana]|uniref:Death domain-containing protein n=1 Tax=Sinanodonta woodiana TaxID=1069815 RepID=A0ABD3WIL0_SINWO
MNSSADSTSNVQYSVPPKQEIVISGTLEQDDRKLEDDTTIFQTCARDHNNHNLQQLRQGTLRKRQSKRRIYTADDTNVPCSFISRKDHERISEWQKSRLRFDELVKKSLKGTPSNETQSDVKDGDQIQAEIHMKNTIREQEVTDKDSTVKGTEEEQLSTNLSSTMNTEISVNLKQRSSFLRMLSKELKVSRDVLIDILKEENRNEFNIRYIKMMEEQYGIVESQEALLLGAIELAFAKLWKQKTAPVDAETDETLMHCDILDALEVPPVLNMFEILLSHIVNVSSIQSGAWVAIPYDHFNIRDWQEACLRELVEDRIWIDLQTTFRCTKKYVDQTEMHFVEFCISDKKTLAVVGRPKVDIAVVESQTVTITSSTDDRISMTVPASLDGTTKVVHLQVVPILPQMVADFMTIYKSYDDDRDYNLDEFPLLGCSPVIMLKITDKSNESQSFTFPFRPQSPRPDSGIVPSMLSSPLTMDHLTNFEQRYVIKEPGSLLTSLSSRAVVSFWAGAGENDTHIVYLINGTTVNMKTLEKPLDGQFVSRPVYEKHARFFTLETKQDMKSTKVHALATSFAEFITKRLIDVKVTQIVESRTVLLSLLPSQNLNIDEIIKQDGVITSTHKIRLEEGSVLCWKIRGNVAVMQDQVQVFTYNSFLGINLGFQIEVINKYTQRSLSTYVGFIQLYSLQGQRTGPMDKWTVPEVDMNWKHLLDIPLTLPKPTNTDMATSWKAPISVPNEGQVGDKFGVDLREISARASADWYRLALALNLQHPRIQSLVQQNKTEDRRELAYQVLLSWFKRTLQLSDKAEMLVTALRRCQEWRLAEELAQRSRTYKLEKHEIIKGN